MKRWMDIKETASYLNVSKDVVYRMAQKGDIPATKLGNLWRFKKEEIDEWMISKRDKKD